MNSTTRTTTLEDVDKLIICRHGEGVVSLITEQRGSLDTTVLRLKKSHVAALREAVEFLETGQRPVPSQEAGDGSEP